MLTSEPSEQYRSCHAGSGPDGATIATACWSIGSLAVAAALGSGVETSADIPLNLTGSQVLATVTLSGRGDVAVTQVLG